MRISDWSSDVCSSDLGRAIASARGRKGSAKRLRELIAQQEQALDDPAAFGTANAAFHEALVAMTGNETLIILYEMVNEVVARAVTAVSQAAGAEEDNGSTATRRRGVRSQRRDRKSTRLNSSH